MQIQRVWNKQHWCLNGLKCQLPEPQQGTDRESQKPVKVSAWVKSLIVQGKGWQKTRSDINEYYCRPGQAKSLTAETQPKNALGLLKYHQWKKVKVSRPEVIMSKI